MKKLIERAIQKKKAGEASPHAEEEKAKALRQEQLEELENTLKTEYELPPLDFIG